MTNETRLTQSLFIGRILFIACLLFASSGRATDSAFNHDEWAKVLSEFVRATGGESRVNYEGLKAKSEHLEAYLKMIQTLPKSAYDSWPTPTKLAFLINVYNAFTVKMVIDNYPVKSFKDIGGVFANPWRKLDQFQLFNEKIGLERLEESWLRKVAEPFDARLLFALSNASRGGPRLGPEPFEGAKLDQMLSEAATLYISDRTRNGYDPKTNTFEVSPIFKWKRDDFIHSAGSVPKFLAARMKLVPPLTEIAIEKANVKYLSYDWSLNRQNYNAAFTPVEVRLSNWVLNFAGSFEPRSTPVRQTVRREKQQRCT